MWPVVGSCSIWASLLFFFFSFENEPVGNPQVCPMIASQALSKENVIAFKLRKLFLSPQRGMVSENQGKRKCCHLSKSELQL